MVIYVHLDLLWKQLGRISVTKFFGHDNVGNWFEVEYQHRNAWNHTSTDQKWEFSVYKQGFMNFMLLTVVLSDSESCLKWVFVVHILLVNVYEQAYGYVFKESSNVQMVGPTRNTPNDFDVSGNGDLPPPPPMTLVETFMAARPMCCAKFCRRNSKSCNRCTTDHQWELIKMDRRWLPHIPSLSEWSPQLSPKQKNPLM
jgi:hypothetical protein